MIRHAIRAALYRLEERKGIVIVGRDLSGWKEGPTHGPRPLAYAALRAGGTSFARIEGGIGRRGFLITWGIR